MRVLCSSLRLLLIRAVLWSMLRFLLMLIWLLGLLVRRVWVILVRWRWLLTLLAIRVVRRPSGSLLLILFRAGFWGMILMRDSLLMRLLCLRGVFMLWVLSGYRLRLRMNRFVLGGRRGLVRTCRLRMILRRVRLARLWLGLLSCSLRVRLRRLRVCL